MNENWLNNLPQNGTGNTTGSGPVIMETNFLSGTETAQKDALYADLFEQNAGGNQGKNGNTKRSALEIIKMIMTFVMPIVVVLALGAGAYASIKWKTDNGMADNFSFLCGILTSGIETTDPSHECQTANAIQLDQEKKKENLEKTIVEQLSLYLPLRISSATSSGGTIAESLAEGDFAKKAFAKKNNANDVLSQFEKIRKSTQSPNLANIECTHLTLVGESTLTAQCTVYGAGIGATDERSLGSSRIEAVRFIEKISDTQTSRFILENPPSTLSVEEITTTDEKPSLYKTKTTVVVTMKYLFHQPQI